MRYLRAGRFLRNSKGLSLVELMVGMGVASVIALVASFAFLMAFDVYIRSIRQYETEQEMSALMHVLRSNLVTATNLEYGGISDNLTRSITRRGAGANVGVGQLFVMDDTNPNATYGGGEWIVAQFNRESSYSNISGRIEAAQIIYTRPGTAGHFSGALYIEKEMNTAPGGGWVRVSPVNASQMFTRLTNFEVRRVDVIDEQGRSVANTIATGNICNNQAGALVSCVGQQVLSAEIAMTMRYFTSGKVENFQWCNRNRFAVNADCALMEGARYTDIDRKIKIVFANNNLQKNEYLPRRPFGNLYFFAPWTPRLRGSR